MDKLSHSLGGLELKLSGATKIGPHHSSAGLPNQDAYDLIALPGFLSLSVADGAGSLARSGEGSEIAVEVAVGMASDLLMADQRRELEPDLLRVLAASIIEARDTVFTLDFWEEAGSTLVLALLSDKSFAVAVLGDSFAVVQDRAGELSLVQPPAVGEFANITKLLTSDGPTVTICWGDLSELSGLALCSDAFEQPTLEQRVPTAGFWSNVFSMDRAGELDASALIDFMDGQGKIEDDATILVLATELDPDSAQEISSIGQRDYSFEELNELANPVQETQPTIVAEVESRGLPRNMY